MSRLPISKHIRHNSYMTSQEASSTSITSSGNRPWYVLITFLLILFSLVPWFNDIAPGLTPLRFFQNLPTPAVNILFALYSGTIILFGWMALMWQSGIRQAWYRFWLALAALVMILGYGIIAVPTGIVTVEYARHDPQGQEKVKSVVHTNTQACPSCSVEGHRDGAKYCYNCGDPL